MRTISILNLKGGVGKTTTAVHLASAGFFARKRTLLIDLDPQNSATDHLTDEEFADQSAGAFIMGKCSFSSACQRILPRQADEDGYASMDLMPSGEILLTEAEVMLQARGSKKTLKNLLEKDPIPHDYIVIDTGPGLNFLWFNALYAADVVLIPVELQMAALQGLKRMHEMLAFAAHEDELKPKVWYLPTNNDGRVRESADLLEVLQDQYGTYPEGQVLPTIRYSSALSKSYGQRASIFEFEPRDRAARDYAKLFNDIIGETSHAQT